MTTRKTRAPRQRKEFFTLDSSHNFYVVDTPTLDSERFVDLHIVTDRRELIFTAHESIAAELTDGLSNALYDLQRTYPTPAHIF